MELNKNTYLSANELLRKLGCEGRIAIPDGYFGRLTYIDRPEVFEKSVQSLNDEDRHKIEDLYGKLISVVTACLDGKLRFKPYSLEVKEGKRCFDTKSYLEVIFSDNVNGYSVLFVPTLNYIGDKPGKDDTDPGHPGSEKNIVVFKWTEPQTHMIDFDHSETIPGEIERYHPEVRIIERNRYLLRDFEDVSGERVRQNLSAFKRTLIERFVPSIDSPVIRSIENLLEKGYRQKDIIMEQKKLATQKEKLKANKNEILAKKV